VRKRGAGLDNLDLRILREMELDGRQPVSRLARRLGISRAHASKRLHRLLDQKIARITAFTNLLALGYRAMAVTGIRVSPGQLYAVADRLRTIPNVFSVVIAAGWQDIIIWTMFANPADLSGFLAKELGSISGITSTETMMVIEWRASLPRVLSNEHGKVFLSYSPSIHSLTWNNQQEDKDPLARQKDRDSDLSVDQLDLMILSEMEQDGRQSVSALARKLHISRGSASARLHRLLNKRITRIIAFTNPASVGYPVFAMIGMRVSPQQIDAVIGKVETLPNVSWVAKVAGRHDVIVGALFADLIELSRFLDRELGTTPGVLATETMIGLELRKMSLAYLASSYLRSIEKYQQET
jgi:Lrp/AsnC family transcriptional regulator for asnA, asnC and gidA